jgi:UDP-N-acetylglucosamine/UDP-N-acetylgalactosamine diphosphorylase
MRAKGVEAVDVCAVDNALARPCDPTFAGFCQTRGVELGARTVTRRGPDEKVGVLVPAHHHGKGSTKGLAVVEYSEMGPDMAAETNETDGTLTYRWANICMHYMTVGFLEKAAKAMTQGHDIPYHIARKTVRVAGSVGRVSQQDAPTGRSPHEEHQATSTKSAIKLERFIFDPFPKASSFALLEVSRDEEFAPVKNANGLGAVDTPDTARALVLACHSAWVRRTGGIVTKPNELLVLPGMIRGGVEVSPTLSYAGEGLEHICEGSTFADGTHISGRSVIRNASRTAQRLRTAMDSPLKSNRTSRAASNWSQLLGLA